MYPNRAVDPGLVYDMSIVDYLDFLCALGYNATAMETFNRGSFVCPTAAMRLQDLNYPSITAFLDQAPYVVNVTRVVTNVGRARSVYVARVEVPGELSVTVAPDTLRFTKVNQEKRFTVTIRPVGARREKGIAEGQLRWVSRKTVVRSPILVSYKKFVQDTAHLTH